MEQNNLAEKKALEELITDVANIAADNNILLHNNDKTINKFNNADNLHNTIQQLESSLQKISSASVQKPNSKAIAQAIEILKLLYASNESFQIYYKNCTISMENYLLACQDAALEQEALIAREKQNYERQYTNMQHTLDNLNIELHESKKNNHNLLVEKEGQLEELALLRRENNNSRRLIDKLTTLRKELTLKLYQTQKKTEKLLKIRKLDLRKRHLAEQKADKAVASAKDALKYLFGAKVSLAARKSKDD